MSDFIAEATVLVRPDTTAFRAQLQTQLAAATKGVVVPVTVVPTAAGAGASGLAQLTQTQTALRNATQQTTGVLQAQDEAIKKGTQSLGQFQKGAVSSLAALTGLRGAVLAASGPFLAAAVAAGAFIKSLQTFAQFEQQLNIFAATTEATGEEMEEVSALARELGADLSLPAVSATDAAVAMTELSKAGLSVEDSLAGARGVLQLSTAAGIGVGEAAQFAANELNAFGLAGDQATRVADILTNAANAAQGSISDFGLAFKQSAAVANLVGLSLEDTAAQLSVLARAGLQGSDAGTSLRVALLRLINPTKEAAAVIRRLEIDLRDAQGNIRPDVFVQFGEATRAFTPAMRDAAFATVFGADAIRTVSIAAEGGREALAEATIAIGEQGSAAEQAEARTAGFGGQLEALKSTASTTAVSLGEVSSVIAGPLVVSLTLAAGAINSVIEPLAELVRLSKEKLGLNFEATTASSAELLVKLQEIRDLTEQSSGENFATLLTPRIEDAIRALEGERAVLKALGIDVTGINVVIQRLQSELEGVGGAGVSGATAAEKALQRLKDLLEQLGANAPQGLRDAMEALRQQIALAAQEGGRFTERFERGLIASKSAADALAASIKGLRGEIAASNSELLKAQNEGASAQTQIALLQGQEQDQFDIIELIKSNGNQAGDATKIDAARREIERIQNEIKSLQDGIVSDQKAAASAAESAAELAQEARDKQFSAIAEMFGGRQENIEDAIERAGIKGNVEAVIRLNKALIESLRREREALLERLRTLKVSNEVRKKILAAIDDAIKEAQNDILRAQQAQQDALQKLLEPIDLRIRIAQAQDNEAKEIALRRKKVELLSKELARLKNANKKNTKEWLELKAQLAEENAAIRDLENQQKTEGKSARQQAAEFFFEQLQAQQGFAANLMGNVITGSTAGLVGVPSDNLPGSQAAVTSNAAQAKGDRGPTSGQASTTNEILRRILQQLRALNRVADSPEAIYQAKVGSGSMTGGGGNAEVL